MNFKRKLPIPQEIKEMYPMSEADLQVKQLNDKQIADIITGRSGKLLLVIGPCSADRADAVMEYIERLRNLQEEVADKIFIVPRIYTNKPRTTCTGYMGMLHQPDPHQSPDLLSGLISIRQLHLKVIRETGFTCADEMLYPETNRMFSDLLSYVAVGARSVENQQHRLTASGLEVPVGMKNPTGGDLNVLMNSIAAARKPHNFIYRNWDVETSGNPLSHAILRGYIDEHKVMHPNYHKGTILHLAEMFREYGLDTPALVVDCNHCNSGKNWSLQPQIAFDVLDSMENDTTISGFVKGLMIESYLFDGYQDQDGHVYGQSITDPCIGWAGTERLVKDIAARL